MNVQLLYIGVGVGLIFLGLFIFAAAKRKSNSAVATHGSVAVGRDNNGPIVNMSTQNSAPSHSGAHWLTIIAIIVEVVGIAVTLWHAFHLAGK